VTACMLSALYAIIRLPVRPSLHHPDESVKMVEDRMMQFLQCSSPFM